MRVYIMYIMYLRVRVPVRLPNIIYLYALCITNSAMIEMYVIRVSSNEKCVRNDSVILSWNVFDLNI